MPADPAHKAFAEGLLAYFPIVGFAGVYLVTRTYLTGALTRADRSTLGAFNRVGLKYTDVLVLQRHWRALSTKGEKPSAEALRIAEKMAVLSMEDLRSPLEFALWAKAKSITGKTEGDFKAALEGYEKAVSLNQNDPELLLDYSVALKKAGELAESKARMEEAYRCISKATEQTIRKNIYKSLTFLYLYEPSPGGFGRVLELMEEYEDASAARPSGGLAVNEACAWGQKFLYLASAKKPQAADPKTPFDLPARNEWSEEMKEAREKALAAIRKALAIDPAWQNSFRELLVRSAGGDEESDLRSFETDAEFRSVLGLPPLAPARGKA